ncbi:MAG TPA: helicase-related protein [Thermohalobaculum sp.]|nr:helicase-related protein [Thermohalobaculum sp.]
MLARGSGIIGLPLRLLAREIYDRICAVRSPDEVALVTGEEKIQPARARYYVCTVEAMPLEVDADFVAVDEIQLSADPERGHIFTDRLLHARGRHETLLLGSDNMRGRIASLVQGVRFDGRERFSTLSYSGPAKISRLKPRTAIVAFSVDQVYAIAELIRRQRGGAAVVLGALSPRTRNAQVALYQQGDVDYIVATDAIGMGLNLDVDHVAFAGLAKFDGRRQRRLEPNELAQIAGRAGRYTRDGTFGVTGEARLIEPQAVEAIENHRFKPLEKLMWRSTELAFATVPALIESLETAPGVPDLMRAREADDLAALKRLWLDPEVRELAHRGDRVRLLWEVCQVPDYRKAVSGDHATLLSRLFRFLLSDRGVIPADWIAAQVERIDRVDGDIDALSRRLAHIRTWTFVANRARWLEDPETWRARTREVEDRLSEALHQRLTQRFVDRRTSVLMRRLKQKEELVADVNDKGEVSVEGHFVGRLDGFRFTVDETAAHEEGRMLRSASLAALKAELARRADRLYATPDPEIELTDQGGLMWGTDAVGRLEKGDAPLAPRVRPFVDDLAEPAVAEKVERRLAHWLQRRIDAQFEPMLKMQADEAITGLARGVAFQVGEAMGVIPRRQVAEGVKALGQDERALLRKHGVRFGQHHVFMPALLKPAPTRLRLILWSLWEGFEVVPEVPPPGLVTIQAVEGAPEGYYAKVGYRLCGARALRIDMLERLADLIRPMDARAGFEATADMLSITGCTLEQFAELMQGLGYEAERGERPRPPRPAKAADETSAAVEPAGEASGEPAAEGAEGAEGANAAAPAPDEAAPATETDAAPVSSAEADVAATSEAASEAASEAPSVEVAGAEPEGKAGGAAPETEIYFVFRLRQRRGPPAERRAEGEGTAARGPRRARTRGEGGQGEHVQGKAGHGKAGQGKGPRRKPGGGAPGAKPDAKPGQQSPAPRREEKPIDPDSPFAILRELKLK